MDELPIGRRMAYWRAQRKLSQQALADRLGKSKSWVDKVERGARRLDKLSTLQEIADTLRIDVSLLLGRDRHERAAPAPAIEADDLDRLRGAVSRYTTVSAASGSPGATGAGELSRAIEHAWLTFQHADHPALVRGLPRLLREGQLTGDDRLLGQVYQLASAVLRKLGEHHLAWLAADRALAAGHHGGDPLLLGSAAIHLGRALLATGQPRRSLELAITVAHRLAPPQPLAASPACLSVYGALLLQAALGAAGRGDAGGVTELLDRATEAAARVGEGQNHHGTAFGPTAVVLTRVGASLLGNDAGTAVTLHQEIVDSEPFRRLPPERRAEHLLDVTGAYAEVGDLAAAGRTLLAADHAAPAEVRARPVGRELVITLLRRAGTTDLGLNPLAAALGVLR